MIRYLSGDQLATYPRLARTMFEDRADQFKTRLGWDAGPHKADIKININNVEAKQILSRGEQKILSILWCCSQHEVLRKIYNINATLIIDDIKSELDNTTFEIFLDLLKHLNNQIIFSCIDDHFSSKIKPENKDFKKFHVEQLK